MILKTTMTLALLLVVRNHVSRNYVFIHFIINNLKTKKIMKDLKLNKEVANRLQDEEMANLVGAGTDITNTKSGKMAQARQVEEQEEGGSSSCCQKSCK